MIMAADTLAQLARVVLPIVDEVEQWGYKTDNKNGPNNNYALPISLTKTFLFGIANFIDVNGVSEISVTPKDLNEITANIDDGKIYSLNCYYLVIGV